MAKQIWVIFLTIIAAKGWLSCRINAKSFSFLVPVAPKNSQTKETMLQLFRHWFRTSQWEGKPFRMLRRFASCEKALRNTCPDGCPRVPPRKNASGAFPSYVKPLIRILFLPRAYTVPETSWTVLMNVPIFLGAWTVCVSAILNCARLCITFVWLISTSDSNWLRASKTVFLFNSSPGSASVLQWLVSFRSDLNFFGNICRQHLDPLTRPTIKLHCTYRDVSTFQVTLQAELWPPVTGTFDEPQTGKVQTLPATFKVEFKITMSIDYARSLSRTLVITCQNTQFARCFQQAVWWHAFS